MKKFEYKVFNLSEVEARNKVALVTKSPYVSWLDILNEQGAKGWEFTGMQPTSQSYLLKREISEKV